MTDIALTELTEAKVAGTGVFDVLMRATKAHLELEYTNNRIQGADYAKVYLGSLESVLQGSLQFLLQNKKIALEAQLLEKQIELAGVEVQKAQAELAILKLNQTKIPAEIALLKAQAGLVIQQTENAKIEYTVLQGQKCKLDAEYEVLLEQKVKTTTETSLLAQKVVTERAQTSATGVEADSVVGKQKALYAAQTNGFIRDAEQKVAKILADTWNVRRTTDDGTSANDTNMLSDVVVGRAISKLLTGVGA